MFAKLEEEQEDLSNVLLRIQKEGGHDVPFTMGDIKSLLVVSCRRAN